MKESCDAAAIPAAPPRLADTSAAPTIGGSRRGDSVTVGGRSADGCVGGSADGDGLSAGARFCWEAVESERRLLQLLTPPLVIRSEMYCP